MSEVLKIAIQKSGRLSEESLALLKECGLGINGMAGALVNKASNFPAEFLLLRDDDIPGYVADGVAHLGIAGLNVVLESAQPVQVFHKLGFGKCRLSIAVPREKPVTEVASLHGKRIATSYPTLTQQFLAEHGVEAHIHEISGSVEIAPNIGLADAICDIVSSGSTLLTNGLTESFKVLDSQAVIISQPKLPPMQQALAEALLFRINSVQAAKRNKYILLNAPNDQLDQIISLLPGMKSPTILPLAQPGWSSLHSVISEDEFWAKLESLKQAGAQGILVVPIEKMIQ